MSEQSKEASKRLKEMRLESGYSVDELAALLKKPTSRIQQYESDLGKIDITELFDIVDVLNISYSYLLEGKSPKKRDEEILLNRLDNLESPEAKQSFYDLLEWLSKEYDPEKDALFRAEFINRIPSIIKNPEAAQQAIELVKTMKTDTDM